MAKTRLWRERGYNAVMARDLPIPQPTSDPATTADPRSPFERFRDLTRHILTTPKAQVVKEPAPKPAKAKGRGK